MKTIGIFGGTFNPVHKGHTNALWQVMNSVKLDRVIIMPSKIPPHKSADELVSEQARLDMCRLAFSGFDGVEISDFELKQDGKSYSVLTLREFHKLYPDDRLMFIMGSDMLLSFDKWYCFEEILSLCGLICVSRSDNDTQKLEYYAGKLREIGGEVMVIPVEPFEVSSTQIRKMLKNKQDCSCYLSDLVVKYILEHSIYRQG